MGQVLQADSVPVISVTSTTVITMQASTAQTIGGGQYPNSAVTCTTSVSGAGGLDTGSIAANTLYYLYLVRSSGVISLVASTNSTSPTGFPQYKRVGRASTNASSQWSAAGNNTTEDTGKVGQVMSAMLSEAQFQAIHGSSWILSDGRSVAGSTYALVAGVSTVPDLRGMALRGKNNGRSDGYQNPDGDSALGTLQDHTFVNHDHGGGNHGHSLSNSVSANAGTFNDSTTCVVAVNRFGLIQGVSAVGSGTIIGAQGGNETRMRNVTVNHFIKIN